MKKGVLKGLKYISQIFEEEEEEMQIGLPTDVKHVAHIGQDGPATESPSWMKEYKAPERPLSAPLDKTGEPLDSSDQNTRDMPDLPKGSRRRTQSLDLTIETPERESSRKSRSTRRHQRKDSSEGSHKSRRRHHRKDSSSSDHEGSSRSGRGGDSQELISSNGDVPESPSSPTARKLPDIPKSSRRKKSKDDTGSTKSSKSKANNAVPPQSTTYNCPFTDPGLVTNEPTISCNSEFCQTS